MMMQHPANRGWDFSFDGSISRHVLENYLSRSLVFEFLHLSINGIDEDMKTLLRIGAKYIARTVTAWIPGKAEYDKFPLYTDTIAKVHARDPEVIFEACISEAAFPQTDEVPVPAYVFEEYSLPVEQRCFSHKAMFFPDGRYDRMWGEGANGGGVPDITRPETRRYWRQSGKTEPIAWNSAAGLSSTIRG